jgi:putative transposon-encoded protein
MWVLKWLPDWIFYFILLVGVVGFAITYLLRFIPISSIYMYKTPIQLGSLFLIAFGTFMSGAIYDNNAWLDKVKELEAKVAKAEQESREANEKLDQATKTKLDKIKEKKIYIKEYIDREVVKYDTKFLPGGQCEIPKEFIGALNQAAKK